VDYDALWKQAQAELDPVKRKDYLDTAPHWALFPGTMIFLVVLSINYVGDGLRDALDARKVL